jgi:hypothetical protein
MVASISSDDTAMQAMDRRAGTPARFSLPAWSCPRRVLTQSGTQRLTAAGCPVRNLFRSLWILGGKPVHNARYWGEQTRKILTSLIRLRFVPALIGTLTMATGIARQILNVG